MIHGSCQLTDLERLINSVTNNCIIEETTSSLFNEAVRKEIERIKFAIVHEVGFIIDDTRLSTYIRFYQHAVIRLMDQIARTRNRTASLGYIKDSFFRECNKGLEHLLDFIQRYVATSSKLI